MSDIVIYRALFSDGYFCNIVYQDSMYRLEGKKLSFNSLVELGTYYKGTIKRMELLTKGDL